MTWYAIVDDKSGELLGYSNERWPDAAVPAGASVIELDSDSQGRLWDTKLRGWGDPAPQEPEVEPEVEAPSAAAQLLSRLSDIASSDMSLEDRLAAIVAALAAQST